MEIRNIILVLIFLLTGGIISHGQTIAVTGDPAFPYSGFNLTEAGSNFESSVTSTTNPTITISHKNGWLQFFGNFNWLVKVDKSDLFWNSNLTIQVRRSGNGSGGSLSNNYISGGTNFQTVTNTPTTFFNGGAVRNNVPIEFRINNISVLIPADDYETTIYFTIYSN